MMMFDVNLTLNLKVEVAEEMVDLLNVDGYDLALLMVSMYGEELLKNSKQNDGDDSYRRRIAIEEWKIDR